MSSSSTLAVLADQDCSLDDRLHDMQKNLKEIHKLLARDTSSAQPQDGIEVPISAQQRTQPCHMCGLLDISKHQLEHQRDEPQRSLLRDVSRKLDLLSNSPDWLLISHRLIRYIVSISSENAGTPTAQSTPIDPRPMTPSTSLKNSLTDTEQRPHARFPQSDTLLNKNITSHQKATSYSPSESEGSLGAVRPSKKRKRDSPGATSDHKPHFCFHDSCASIYKAPKALKTHIRNEHQDQMKLPGTCDHDGAIKEYRTWEDSLAHMIHHQKVSGMTKAQYDKLHYNAGYWIDSKNNVRRRDSDKSREASKHPQSAGRGLANQPPNAAYQHGAPSAKRSNGSSSVGNNIVSQPTPDYSASRNLLHQRGYLQSAARQMAAMATINPASTAQSYPVPSMSS